MDPADVTNDARPSTGVDTWLILALSGWLSLVAGVGWIALPFVGPLGTTMDRLQYPGAPTAGLFNAALAAAFLLAFIVPIAATIVPATAWFDRLAGRTRKTVTWLWLLWLAVGIAGLATALVTGAGGFGFFLIEAAVPSVVGLCIVTLLAGIGAMWRRHLGGVPLWRTQLHPAERPEVD